MLKIIGVLFLGVFTFCSGSEETITEAEAVSLETPSEEVLLDSSSAELIKGVDELDLPPVEIKDPDAVELTWATLADVEYNEVYLEELDAWFWEPEFGETVQSFEGKQVYITGYMVPVDVDANYFVLSIRS